LVLTRSLLLSRWQRLRFEQLLREDIRTDTRIRELGQIESLAQILSRRSGDPVVYASLGAEVQVDEVTTRKWISTLNAFFFGFLVKPWSKRVANAIRKTPKWYLRDWSSIQDPGKRNETLVACHLLKAVELWTDLGLGEYDLFYIRDKQKREVDFLVSKDGEPWFLVEVKTSETKLSPTLATMQRATGAKHALQVVFGLPFEAVDCFQFSRPMVVPAPIFLSQLP
jgi:predicted AAA+ superfamily ATPase